MLRRSLSVLMAIVIVVGVAILTIAVSEPLQAAVCPDYTPRADPNSIVEQCKPNKNETEQQQRDRQIQGEIEKWFQKPLQNEPREIHRDQPRPLYKFRKYDVCVPGLETIKGCDSNPDIKPCADGTYPIVIQIYSLEGRYLSRQIYCPGDPTPPNVPKEFVQEEKQIIITPEKFRSYPIKGSQD